MDSGLIQYLENIRKIANKAYWKHETDCGGDITEDCVDCKHREVCQANNEITDILKSVVQDKKVAGEDYGDKRQIGMP